MKPQTKTFVLKKDGDWVGFFYKNTCGIAGEAGGERDGMQDAGLASQNCGRAAVGGQGRCGFARALLAWAGGVDLGAEAGGFAKKPRGGASLLPLPSACPAGKHQGLVEERKLRKTKTE